MSFSLDVKKELCSSISGTTAQNVAEITAIINTSGTIFYENNEISVKISSANPYVAEKFFKLLKESLNISAEITIRKNSQLKKSRIYSVCVSGKSKVEKLLTETELLTRKKNDILIVKKLGNTVLKNDDCKKAYIRGCFISGGSLSDPKKSYHLEFINTDLNLATDLQNLINEYDLNSKVIERKGCFVVYLKEGEHIVDLLNVIGAHKSLMNLENVRIIKDMRNSVNRIVNCEMANISKTVSAATNQINDINFIESTKGLGFLSEKLEEVAILRLGNPEASLLELADVSNPPLSKSCINHRLRKISEIAKNLKGVGL